MILGFKLSAGCRRILEEYHKGQKTGCGIRNPQFTESDRLHPMIAFLSVVALSLLNLRELSRRDNAKTRPATSMFSEEYVSVLSTCCHGVPEPDWTIHDFCLALARFAPLATTCRPAGTESQCDQLPAKMRCHHQADPCRTRPSRCRCQTQ